MTGRIRGSHTVHRHRFQKIHPKTVPSRSRSGLFCGAIETLRSLKDWRIARASPQFLPIRMNSIPGNRLRPFIVAEYRPPRC